MLHSHIYLFRTQQFSLIKIFHYIQRLYDKDVLMCGLQVISISQQQDHPSCADLEAQVKQDPGQ